MNTAQHTVIMHVCIAMLQTVKEMFLMSIFVISVHLQVFRALHLQMFEYDTFRRHARSYIEPAIVAKWKETQDGMLLRLMEGKVIVGGDMRADSPGTQCE